MVKVFFVIFCFSLKPNGRKCFSTGIAKNSLSLELKERKKKTGERAIKRRLFLLIKEQKMNRDLITICGILLHFKSHIKLISPLTPEFDPWIRFSKFNYFFP